MIFGMTLLTFRLRNNHWSRSGGLVDICESEFGKALELVKVPTCKLPDPPASKLGLHDSFPARVASITALATETPATAHTLERLAWIWTIARVSLTTILAADNPESGMAGPSGIWDIPLSRERFLVVKRWRPNVFVCKIPVSFFGFLSLSFVESNHNELHIGSVSTTFGSKSDSQLSTNESHWQSWVVDVEFGSWRPACWSSRFHFTKLGARDPTLWCQQDG